MTAVGYADRPAAPATPALFGRVMALVALTVGFATLGVWAARSWGGGGWFVAWLLALLAAGIFLIFVRIPAAYTAWSVVGLGVFGLYTVVDFNRLRRAGKDEAIPLAAGIFIDVLNIFLLFLRLFGRSS